MNTYLPRFKPTPLGKGAEELRLKVPAPSFNPSYKGVAGSVELAFYHDDKEVKRVAADIAPGESVFFPRELPDPEERERKRKEKGKGPKEQKEIAVEEAKEDPKKEKKPKKNRNSRSSPS